MCLFCLPLWFFSKFQNFALPYLNLKTKLISECSFIVTFCCETETLEQETAHNSLSSLLSIECVAGAVPLSQVLRISHEHALPTLKSTTQNVRSFDEAESSLTTLCEGIQGAKLIHRGWMRNVAAISRHMHLLPEIYII